MPIFTIQLHAATALHYDFRLEVDGVLRSWAVPKGPSTEPAEKRLAIEVPDHALDYANFEGRIGGGYGRGAVIVWDRGEYRPLTDGPFGAALDAGHASFWLEGEKLHGGWTLQRTSEGTKPQWLLIKRRDEHAGADEPGAASVLSGRTIEEVQARNEQPHDRGTAAGGRAGVSDEPAEIRVGRRVISISHPDKVLFPDTGFTKKDLAEHYARAGKLMIPHMKGRPLTMHVFPAGLAKNGIYIKKAPAHFPEWIERKEIEKREGGTTTMALANEAATLVFLAGQNCITPHVWPAKVDDLEHPDRLIFDFDPPEGTDFAHIRAAARATGDMLRELGLSPYAMTSGSRGLHVIAPVRRDADWKLARAFAHVVGEKVAENDSEHLTVQHRIANRGGRIYVDTTRNNYGQHGVAPYAVRAKPAAPVATPLAWDELDDSSLSAQTWTIANIEERLGSDPWKGIGRTARSVSKAAEKLGVAA